MVLEWMAPALGASAAAGLASATHCAGMCGPLALVGCSRGGRAALLPSLGYASGRLASYSLTGALAGGLGAHLATLPDVTTVRAVASCSVALGVALAAWRLLRAPDGAPAAPSGSARPVPLKRAPSKPPWWLGVLSMLPRNGLALGLVTGFLPCGALLTGLLIAAGTASPWAGALVMDVFALASAPGLVAAVLAGDLVARRLSGERARVPRKVLGWVLVAVAILLAARPWLVASHTCHAA